MVFKSRDKSCRGIFKKLNLLTLSSLYIYQASLLARKYCSEKTNKKIHEYNTRTKDKLHVGGGCEKSPLFNCIPIYNKLPKNLVELVKLDTFKKKLKEWLIEKEFYEK